MSERNNPRAERIRADDNGRRLATLRSVSSAVKLLPPPVLARHLAALRRRGKRVVFTNGCFDLIHPGHVRYLRKAKQLGDVLVVALNSDASVRRLKGPTRPLVPQRDRCEVMAALEMVDFVTVFNDDTPYKLISRLQPDVLVKGGDWTPERIVGADIVRGHGGTVRSLRFAPGYSTTRLVERITQKSRAHRPSRPSPGGTVEKQLRPSIRRQGKAATRGERSRNLRENLRKSVRPE